MPGTQHSLSELTILSSFSESLNVFAISNDFLTNASSEEVVKSKLTNRVDQNIVFHGR